MNQGLIWRWVLAAPFVFGATGAVVAQYIDPAGEEALPLVFEELSPIRSSANLAAHVSSAPIQGASCALAPTCCTSNSCACPQGACGCSDNSECCSPCRPATAFSFIVGSEATFLAPQSHGLGATATGTDLTLPAIYEVSELADFDGMTFAPRLWLGVQGAEWGVVGRFWYLSDSDDHFHPFDQPAGGTPGTFADDRLKAYTVDWEFTRGVCYCDNKFDFSVGGRYASLEADSAVAVAGLANGGADFFHSTAIADVEFDGYGVTSSIGSRIPIADCCGCVYLLWNLRGSMLWGDAANKVQTSTTVIGAGSNGTSIDSARVIDTASLYSIEAQLGAQWEHELRCMPAAAFFRVVAEYQYWNLNTGGEVESLSNAFTADATADARAESDDFRLNLLGLSIGTGLTW